MLYTNRLEKSFCGIIEYDDTRLLAAVIHRNEPGEGWGKETDGAAGAGYEDDPEDDESHWQEADEEADAEGGSTA
ncbi:hypothetical protein LL912_02300 [Niabella sp. CC-SYL272]|uniref:hypothetical protein n=1 Tax=Niabella agricola TaxID=2891571 RepID=UPI001F170C7D|nr:hypothetical protein [Niabella agricola]MCF3107601.1 hypothetical protein [Niabella agricola]